MSKKDMSNRSTEYAVTWISKAMSKLRKVLFLAGMFSFSGVSAGTWDYGSFDNDTASDWIYELKASNDISTITSALDLAHMSGYLDADVCSIAIAASEVGASLKDGHTDNLPEEVSAWVLNNRSKYTQLISAKAKIAIDNCLDLNRSELAQLWSEGDADSWVREVKLVKERL